jgi:hypothetical protein
MFTTKTFNKTITLEQERDNQMNKPQHFAGLIRQGEQQFTEEPKTVEQLIRQQEQQLNRTWEQERDIQVNTQHTTYYPAWFNGEQTQVKLQELNGQDVLITGVAGKLTKTKQQLFNMQQLEQLECMEPKIKTLIKVTHEAILDCGMCPTVFNGKSTGVFVGASSNIVQQSEKIAQHVSKFFEFIGPAVVHQTPCTSSLMALDNAITALKNGECRQAIVADFHPLSTICVVVLQLNPTFNGKYYASIVHSKNMTPEQRLFKGEPTYPVGAMHTRVLRQMYATNGIDASIVNTVEKQLSQELTNTVFVPATVCNTVPVFVGQRELNQQQTGLYTIIKMMKQMQQGCMPANLYYQRPCQKVATLLASQGKNIEQNNTKFFGGLMALNAFGSRGDNIHILMTPNTMFTMTLQGEEQMTLKNFTGLIRQGEQQPQYKQQMTVEQYRHQLNKPFNGQQEQYLIRQGEQQPQYRQQEQQLIRQGEQQPQYIQQEQYLVRQGEQQPQYKQQMTVEQYRHQLNKPQFNGQQELEQQLREFITEQIKFYQRQQQKQQQQQTIVQLINEKLELQFPEAIFGQTQEQQHFIDQLIDQLIKQEQVKETILIETVLPRSHSVEFYKRQPQLTTPYIPTEETPLCKLVKKIVSGNQQLRIEQTLEQLNVEFKILDKVQKVLEQHHNMKLTLREINQLTIQQLSVIEQQKFEKIENRSFFERQRGEQVARFFNQIYRNL